jgi:hypothetical protein
MAKINNGGSKAVYNGNECDKRGIDKCRRKRKKGKYIQEKNVINTTFG